MARLRDLESYERPRERMLRDGESVLTPEELLALVLGTGRGGREDALELGHRVFAELGGLAGLREASVDKLREVPGIGPVKASRIRAAIEMGRRASLGNGERAASSLGGRADDPMARSAQRLRGQLPAGEQAVLGWRSACNDPPITLVLRESLGPQSRLGSILARLIVVGPGPWSVASLRPGGPPSSKEKETAARIRDAAGLLGLELEHVLIIGGNGHWDIGREAVS